MKFLFLSGHAHLALDPSAQHASGGAELQVALLSLELISRGHDVAIVAAEVGQPMASFSRGGKFFQVAASTPAELSTLCAPCRGSRGSSREKPDYVVVYGWTAWLYVFKNCALVPFRLVFVCALDAEIDGGFRRAEPVRGFSSSAACGSRIAASPSQTTRRASSFKRACPAR